LKVLANVLRRLRGRIAVVRLVHFALETLRAVETKYTVDSNVARSTVERSSNKASIEHDNEVVVIDMSIHIVEAVDLVRSQSRFSAIR
jgi:translation elongation factor P/translation initiation factor 5A